MRRTILRLLGISLAAGALLLYINSTDDDEAGFDPAGRLSCADTNKAAARATVAPTARETRAPAELAAAWANARDPDLVKGQHHLHTEPARVDIAFDRRAQTVAVLTFRSHDDLGWYLDAVVACQASTKPS
ncbi:hypothetical protein KZZ52_29355 [Dactylosporangium sp. AC04546]|uniref:hypothetical protein n=1 Tax=Dactylosporangium sp. AC04546 TaxID=2862460 RepID=UPI002E7AB0F6|nr:hypothetical protein [Dactylosporangium sp. AC04546]WVK89374.1 hypothetical protein KZZ52_29355 [Dactylosporangium sp. AC04546]